MPAKIKILKLFFLFVLFVSITKSAFTQDENRKSSSLKKVSKIKGGGGQINSADANDADEVTSDGSAVPAGSFWIVSNVSSNRITLYFADDEDGLEDEAARTPVTIGANMFVRLDPDIEDRLFLKIGNRKYYIDSKNLAARYVVYAANGSIQIKGTR